MLLVLCTLTASRLSVTKAGGISDTPGAERSTGGGNGDTVTYRWLLSEGIQGIFEKNH